MMQAEPRYVSVNGEATDALSVNDRGLNYGDGLFETMRFVKRAIPFLPQHLDRLARDSARLGISVEMTRVKNAIERACEYLASENISSGKVKVIVTRGVGGRGVYPPSKATPSVVVVAEEAVFPQSLEREAVVSPIPLPTCSHTAGIKHLNRLPYILGAQELSLSDGQEVIFLNSRRDVVEGMHHNLFFLNGDVLYTPALSEAGVRGVMRDVIQQNFAPELHLEYREGTFSVEQVTQSDASFLTNAVQGIVVLNTIDGVPLRKSEIVLSLQEKFLSVMNAV